MFNNMPMRIACRPEWAGSLKILSYKFDWIRDSLANHITSQEIMLSIHSGCRGKWQAV